jgi:hypothetical protein
VLSLRTTDEEGRATYAASQVVQLYAVLLHCVVAGFDRMITATVPKGSCFPILFATLDTNFGKSLY